MNRVFSVGLGLLVAVATFAGTANAGTMISPVSVSSDMGEFSGDFALAYLIDQSGLSAGYTSGVTDFDTYFAGNPTADDSEFSYWFPPANGPMGYLQFDFAQTVTLASMAVWNVPTASGIKTFNLVADDDGDFTNGGTITLLSAQEIDNNGAANAVPAQIVNFTPTSLLAIRIEVTETQLPDTFAAAAREVAFGTGTAAIPEPASIALLASGSLVLIRRRRR